MVLSIGSIWRGLIRNESNYWNSMVVTTFQLVLLSNLAFVTALCRLFFLFCKFFIEKLSFQQLTSVLFGVFKILIVAECYFDPCRQFLGLEYPVFWLSFLLQLPVLQFYFILLGAAGFENLCKFRVYVLIFE